MKLLRSVIVFFIGHVKQESEEEDEIAALSTVESERRDGDEEMYIARTSR